MNQGAEEVRDSYETITPIQQSRSANSGENFENQIVFSTKESGIDAAAFTVCNSRIRRFLLGENLNRWARSAEQRYDLSKFSAMKERNSSNGCDNINGAAENRTRRRRRKCTNRGCMMR